MKLAAFGVVASATLLAPALADDRSDVLRRLSVCSDMEDTSARLACFDAAKPSLKAAIAGTDAPAAPVAVAPRAEPAAETATAPPQAEPPQQVAAASPPPAPVGSAQPTEEQRRSWFGLRIFGGGDGPQTTPEAFGSENIEPTEPAEGAPPKQIDRITSNIVSVSFDGRGRFTVTLDNGQMWRQIQSDTGYANVRGGRTTSVEIERAALGSYSLKFNDRNRKYKVERIK